MTLIETISKENYWLVSQVYKQNIEKKYPNALARWKRARPPTRTISRLLMASESHVLLDRNQDEQRERPGSRMAFLSTRLLLLACAGS